MTLKKIFPQDKPLWNNAVDYHNCSEIFHNDRLKIGKVHSPISSILLFHAPIASKVNAKESGFPYQHDTFPCSWPYPSSTSFTQTEVFSTSDQATTQKQHLDKWTLATASEEPRMRKVIIQLATENMTRRRPDTGPSQRKQSRRTACKPSRNEYARKTRLAWRQNC